MAQEELNFKKDSGVHEQGGTDEVDRRYSEEDAREQRSNFEAAAEYRDQMLQLKTMLQDL